MADTVTIKKITDLPENTDANDADLFMQGVNGTASLRKIKWSTILAKIKSKLLANNLTTTQEGYALDARQGKALSDQINAQNTKITYMDVNVTAENLASKASKSVEANISIPEGKAILGASIIGNGYNGGVIQSICYSSNSKIAVSFYNNESSTKTSVTAIVRLALIN